MGNPLDDWFSKYTNQPNPPTPDPLAAWSAKYAAPAQPNFFQQALDKVVGIGKSIWEFDKQIAGQTLDAIGVITRPLGAPQQLLYGALAGDAGKGIRTAVNDLTSYVAEPFSDPRIQGSELIKQASSSLKTKGVPDVVANVGGFAMDIVLDPTNWATLGAGVARKVAVAADAVGDFGKAAKFAKVADTIDLFAAPAKTAFQTIPKNTREAAAQKLWNFTGREIGGNALLDRQSIAEFIAPPDVIQRFAPAQVSAFIGSNRQAQSVIRSAGHMTGMRVAELEALSNKVLSNVPENIKQEFGTKLNQFITHENPNDAAQTWHDLEQLAIQHNVDPQQLFDLAASSTRVGTFNSAIMTGTSLEVNNLMRTRLGIPASDVKAVAPIADETARLRMQIPDAQTQARLGVTPGTPYGQFVDAATREAQTAMGNVPTVTWGEILSGKSVRRGLNRSMNVYGADGAAHIEMLRAENRPQTVDIQRLTDVANQVFTHQLGPQIAQTFEQYANQGLNLLDALEATKNVHNLDAAGMKSFLDGILNQTAFIPSGADTAMYMRNARAAKQGASGDVVGSALGGTAKQRLELTDQQLQDLGEVRNVLANAYKDSMAANAQVTLQTEALAAKKFVIDNGLYIAPTERVVPAAQMNEGWAKPGFRVITKAMSDATGGVFEVGATVPDYVAREFQVATSMKGAAGIAVLRNAMSNWQTIKMSNPKTIIQNVVTNMTLASSYAPAPLGTTDLFGGLMKFLSETKDQRYAREASGLGVWSSEMMGLKSEVDAVRSKLAGTGLGTADRMNAIFEDLIGRNLQKPALVPRVGDVATLGATYLGRNLFTAYKASEDLFRSAAYYAMQSKHGMDPATAADHATSMFFDYSARPGMVDTMAKVGIPFQTYPQLATWRTLQTLYDAPNLIRGPVQAVQNLGNTLNNPKEQMVAQDYIDKQGPVRIGTDSQGRGIIVPLAQFLPLGAATALADNVNNSNIGIAPVPPLLALTQAVWGGTGFRGKKTYDGLGGTTFSEAFTNDPVETTRRMLKTLYEFGVYPWSPGTPVFERLTRAIVANGKPLSQLEQENKLPPNSLQNIAARVGVNGPFLWGEGADAVGNYNPLRQAPSDPLPAAARAFGFANYEVQSATGAAGQARSMAQGKLKAYQDKIKYWKDRVQQAPPFDRKRILEMAKADVAQIGVDAQTFWKALNTP